MEITIFICYKVLLAAFDFISIFSYIELFIKKYFNVRISLHNNHQFQQGLLGIQYISLAVLGAYTSTGILIYFLVILYLFLLYRKLQPSILYQTVILLGFLGLYFIVNYKSGVLYRFNDVSMILWNVALRFMVLIGLYWMDRFDTSQYIHLPDIVPHDLYLTCYIYASVSMNVFYIYKMLNCESAGTALLVVYLLIYQWLIIIAIISIAYMYYRKREALLI